VLETLPDSALLVLASWLNVYQLWTLASSCRAMRQRLQKYPALWSSFKTTDISNKAGPRDTIARAIVRLTGRPPARLKVDGPVDISSGSLIRLISDWMPTLEVLHARFYMDPSNSLDYQDFDAVTDTLARPASNLDTLDISLGSSLTEVHDLSTSFLGAIAGRLRRCGLENIRLDLSAPGLYPALSTLTTFRFITHGTTGHSIDVSHLQTLLDSLPLLENFAHTFQEFTGIADGSTTPTLRLPPRLKSVSIINFRSGPVKTASVFITVPTITIAGVDRGLYSLFPGDIRLSLPKQSRWRIQFLDGSDGSRTVLMFSRIRQQMPHITVQYLGMEVPTTARVTRVQLHEWQWHNFILLPAFPQLQELCIVLASCSEYDPRVHDGAGFLVLSISGTPHIPKFTSLRQLEIYSGARYWDISREGEECAQLRRSLAGVSRWQGGSRTCHSHLRCPMSLDGVADILLWLIGPDRRLDRLVLGGITDIVDGDPATALGRLETMTETIEFIERPPRDVVRDCRLSPSDGVHLGMRFADSFSFENDFSWKDSIDPF